MGISIRQWLATSCDAGWRRHARFLGLGWLGGIAACAAAAVAGNGLYYFLDFRWSGRPLSGLMTLASGFCLVTCAAGMFVASRRAMRTPGHAREAAGWILAGLGGIWLAFDEVAQLHELAVAKMARMGVPQPFGVLDHDLYIFGGYALGLLVVMAMLWPTRRPLEPAMLPLSVAIVCFAASEMLDQIPWDLMAAPTQQWVGTLEEVSKTLGTWTLAMCGLLCADEATREQARAPAPPEPRGGRPA